jgi:integration host factor subunit beta
LIEALAVRFHEFPHREIELSVKSLIDFMGDTLSAGERIEIRGFGSFSLHYRPPRLGRNPKTGVAVPLESKFVPHFRPGKELRDRVNEAPRR